jgi:hypothetical protein
MATSLGGALAVGGRRRSARVGSNLALIYPRAGGGRAGTADQFCCGPLQTRVAGRGQGDGRGNSSERPHLSPTRAASTGTAPRSTTGRHAPLALTRPLSSLVAKRGPPVLESVAAGLNCWGSSRFSGVLCACAGGSGSFGWPTGYS